MSITASTLSRYSKAGALLIRPRSADTTIIFEVRYGEDRTSNELGPRAIAENQARKTGNHPTKVGGEGRASLGC